MRKLSRWRNPTRCLPVALIAWIGIGCGGSATDQDLDVDLVDEVAAPLSAKGGYTGKYNNTQDHWDVCVKLANQSNAPLLFPDGKTPTGYVLTFDQLAYDAGEKCEPGEVRLDLLEIRDSPAGRLAFHRGGNGYADHKHVRYGHIRLGDLSYDGPGTVGDRVRLEGDDPGENGRTCPASKKGATKGHYYVRPKPIETEMKYCHTAQPCSQDPISYRTYGDPAQVYGTQPSAHYTYLTWNWINVAGGGVARALLKQDDVFHRCDVPAIKLASVTEEGVQNGWVQAVYGKTRQGGEWYYGWIVHSHRYTPPGGPKGPVVWHVARIPEYY